MRRKDREITDPEQIAGIMSRCGILRIALNTDSVPYILPVNFGMEPDGMTLYIHGAMTGRKYELIAGDNRAGFEMDCGTRLVLDEQDHECSMVYESVVGWGEIHELTEEGEKRHALMRIMSQYHAEEFPFDEGPLPRTRILRLDVRQRTAKSCVKAVSV